MAEPGRSRRVAAERFRLERAIENALTAQQARLFVRSIQNTWQVPPIDWSPGQSIEQYADARRLLHAASIFEETDGPNSDAAASCYRRAGEILEWLARSNDGVTKEVPLEVLSAGAYQLAGLPAMATGLLKRAKLKGAGAIMGAFLAGEFGQVLEHIGHFWILHEDLTGREGSASLLDGIDRRDRSPGAEEVWQTPRDDKEDDTVETTDGRIAWYVVVETVRSLGLIAEGLRRGEVTRTALALEKLTTLAELSTRIASDETWVMLRLIRATAERFARNSLHRLAAPLASGSPEKMTQLQRFAREQFARGRGVLWPSQAKGLERLVAGNAFALCTPTGSGKTLVANLALVKELLLGAATMPGAPASLALYIVPSRALAGEVEAKLTAEFRSEDIRVTGLYGGTDWGITDNWLTADKPTVLIATVEKAEALMRYVGHLLVQRLRILIIDEAHQVVVAGSEKTMRELAAHGDRAMRLESLVSRLFSIRPDISRIALTAVAGGAARPVARWVEGSDEAVPVGLGYRSSRQLVGSLECRPSHSPRVTLELNNGQTLYVRGREDPIFLRLGLPEMPDPPAAVKDSLPHYVQNHALWTALNLTAGGRRILISVTQAPERIMKRFAEALNLKGWNTLPPFAPVAGENTTLFNEVRAACIDYCGADAYEVVLLDHGIATSHGQMPQRLRRLMVALIEQRVCPVTVATATLTEGVNLPFDLIILPSLERTTGHRPNGAPITEILPPSEFRNLAGRTGRPGAAESMEGMTLVCLPMTNSTAKIKEQLKQRNQCAAFVRSFERLLGTLAREERSDAVVHAPLQTLLRSIWQKAHDYLGLRTIDDLHAFLENSLPEHVGTDLGVASDEPKNILGDSLDELDALILAALSEVEGLTPMEPGDVESVLRRVWSKCFTRYANAIEPWMEGAFIKRGRAAAERLYPDAAQRRALYQIGFTPYVGRQFQLVSPAVLAVLREAADYGRRTSEQRFDLVLKLGELTREGRGFGFTSRSQSEAVLIKEWHRVAGWWLQRASAPAPPREDLRRWQGFVANNLEFRLGVAVGAAVAEAWNANAAPFDVPSLETWRATTDLPWIGFWFRELLRWGTMDPFVAFALAQGVAGTREIATAMRAQFEAWLVARGGPIADEDLIDPQLFNEWNASRPRAERSASSKLSVPAELSGVRGDLGRYAVRPIEKAGQWMWIDPAGYLIARSAAVPQVDSAPTVQHDYELEYDSMGSWIHRTY
jgi:hypothetical protein